MANIDAAAKRYDDPIEEKNLSALYEAAIEIFGGHKDQFLAWEFLKNLQECKSLSEFENILKRYLARLHELYKDYGDLLKKEQGHMQARMNKFLEIKKMILENSAYDFSGLEEILNPYLHLEIPASKDSIGEIKIYALKAIAETQVITKGQTSVILSEEVIRKTKRLKNAICEYFQIDEKSLFEETRKQPIARIRQIYMYLLRKLKPDLSYPDIAHLTGKEDHTTVIHACNKISELYKTFDEETKTNIDNILTLYKTGEKPERLADEEIEIDVDAILTFYKKTLKKSGLPVETQTTTKQPIKRAAAALIAKPGENPEIEPDVNVEEIKLLTLKKIVREAFRRYRYWSIPQFLDRFEECKSTIEFEAISKKFLKELDKEEAQASSMGIEEVRKQQIEILKNAMGLLDYALSEGRKEETLTVLDNEPPYRAAQKLGDVLMKVSKTTIGTLEPKITNAAPQVIETPKPKVAADAAEKPAKTNAALQVVKPPKPEVAIDKVEKPLATKAAPKTKTSPLLEAGDSINSHKTMNDKEYMILVDTTLFFESKPLLDNTRILSFTSELIEIREKLSEEFMGTLRRFLRLAKKQALNHDDVRKFTEIIQEEMQFQKNKIIGAAHL